MKLPFHPPGKQPVFYKEKESIQDVLDRRANVDSMFMAYLNLNKVNAFARNFTYGEIPKYFTWDGKLKQYKQRERGFSIGRINYVPHKMEDEYYMRILLGIVPGPTSDDDIRTYKRFVYETYKKACFARGIVEDDQAYIDSLLEGSIWFFGKQLRNYFTMMLLDGCLSRPDNVWEQTEFSKWILAVGDGKVSEPNDGEALIDIPEVLIIRYDGEPIDAISRADYGDLS
ncbi:hypothetical protein CARUB_v100246550mg, partial [Capsella rubella]